MENNKSKKREPAGVDDWEEIDDWQDENAAPPSALESGARGAGQGLSFGFGDELSGAYMNQMGALKKLGANLGLMDPKGDPQVETYLKYRNADRAKNKLAQKTNPKSYMAGELGGSVASSFIPGAGLAGKGFKGAAKVGGLIGLGSSESEDLRGQALDTAVGAAGGLLGEGVNKGIGKVASAVGKSKPVKAFTNKLNDFAERRAVKQLDPSLADERGLRHQGRLNKLGRLLLDEKVIGPLTSTAKAGKRLEPMLEATGERLGTAEGQLDDMLAQVPSHQLLEHGFNPSKTAGKIDEKVLGELRDDPALFGIANELQPNVDKLRSLGEGQISFQKAGKIKRGFDKRVNFEKGQTPNKETLKKIRGVINDDLESAADNISSDMHGNDVYKNWKADKERYGLLSKAADMTGDSAARSDKNRWLSPSDYAMLGIGGLAGAGSNRDGVDPISGGLIGVGLNRFGRHYGNAVSANIANALAKRLSRDVGKRGASMYPVLGAQALSNGFDPTGGDDFKEVPLEAPRAPQAQQPVNEEELRSYDEMIRQNEEDDEPSREPQSMSAAEELAAMGLGKPQNPEIAGSGGLMQAMDEMRAAIPRDMKRGGTQAQGNEDDEPQFYKDLPPEKKLELDDFFSNAAHESEKAEAGGDYELDPYEYAAWLRETGRGNEVPDTFDDYWNAQDEQEGGARLQNREGYSANDGATGMLNLFDWVPANEEKAPTEDELKNLERNNPQLYQKTLDYYRNKGLLPGEEQNNIRDAIQRRGK